MVDWWVATARQQGTGAGAGFARLFVCRRLFGPSNCSFCPRQSCKSTLSPGDCSVLSPPTATAGIGHACAASILPHTRLAYGASRERVSERVFSCRTPVLHSLSHSRGDWGRRTQDTPLDRNEVSYPCSLLLSCTPVQAPSAALPGLPGLPGFAMVWSPARAPEPT